MSGRPDPQALLDFWFAGATRDPELAQARLAVWFAADPALDAELERRFGHWLPEAADGRLDAWRETPRSCLGLVLLLDQLPRNLRRGSPAAFENDARALLIAREAVAGGQLEHLTPVEQGFLLLPYEHAESREVQGESVRLFESCARIASTAWQPLMRSFAGYARSHSEIVERFGRFPHRNAPLDRPSTPEEQIWLAGGGERFGQ